MTYPIVEDEEARKWWATWARQSAAEGMRVDMPEVPRETTNRNSEEKDYGEIARKIVVELKAIFLGQKGGDESPSNDRFEAEASVLMHRGLGLAEPVSDPGFWIWLACVPGAELIAMRYPELPKKDDQDNGEKPRKFVPDRNNYTSASARETFFYRLWVRGHLGHQPGGAGDEYALARCGDVDFWRSHILRQSSTESDEFRMALIRFQYPNGAGTKSRLSQNRIRKFVKRLKRASANMNIEALTAKDAQAMIEREWEAMNDG